MKSLIKGEIKDYPFCITISARETLTVKRARGIIRCCLSKVLKRKGVRSIIGSDGPVNKHFHFGLDVHLSEKEEREVYEWLIRFFEETRLGGKNAVKLGIYRSGRYINAHEFIAFKRIT
jgi:hypothetical protein